MFNVCVEYKEKNHIKYFYDVKYLKTTDNQMHLFCEYGITILLDLADVENINIYHINKEDDNAI